MKNISLLSCILFVSLPAAATVPLEEIMKDVSKQENIYMPIPVRNNRHPRIRRSIPRSAALCSSCDCTYRSQPPSLLSPVGSASFYGNFDKKSIYCPELQCWSLKECLQHNKRLIFFNHMLHASKKKKQTREIVSPVLPMFPQTLRYVIGSYAQEIPTQYKIKRYEEIRRTSHLEDRAKLDNQGILSMDATDKTVVLKTNQKECPTITIALSPIEAGFFKSTLDNSNTLPHHVMWQYTVGANIALLIQNKEDLRALTQDKLLLKPSSDYNKALKKAGLLLKKVQLKDKA